MPGVPDIDPDRAYSVASAAALLTVDRSTIRDAIGRGRLPATQLTVGMHEYRIAGRDLADWWATRAGPGDGEGDLRIDPYAHYSQHEAARLAGCDAATIHRARRAGDLPADFDDGIYRVRGSALLAWMAFRPRGVRGRPLR